MPKPTQGSVSRISLISQASVCSPMTRAKTQEDARGRPDRRPLAQGLDLGRDLGLGQLDLLAHQQRGLLGDLLDDLAEGLVGRVAVGRRHLPITRRIVATIRPPAKAAPT